MHVHASSASEIGGESLPVLCRRAGLWPDIQSTRTFVTIGVGVAGADSVRVLLWLGPGS